MNNLKIKDSFTLGKKSPEILAPFYSTFWKSIFTLFGIRFVLILVRVTFVSHSVCVWLLDNHGWANISSVVIRVLGSLFNIFVRISRHSALALCQTEPLNSSSFSRIASRTSSLHRPENGTDPHSRAYRMTPTLHTSYLKLHWSLSIISGAMKARVPCIRRSRNSFELSMFEASVATPKSAILSFGFALWSLVKIFKCFKSRCTIPCLWMCCSPFTIYRNMYFAWFSGRYLTPRACKYMQRSPPFANFVTWIVLSLNLNFSIRQMTFSWPWHI